MGTHTAEHWQAASPLWFFLLQFNGSDDPYDSTFPCGFWSSEKYPTSIPAGITFDPVPRFERIRMDEEAPLLTSTQVLGDLVFTTQTKYAPALGRFRADLMHSY